MVGVTTAILSKFASSWQLTSNFDWQAIWGAKLNSAKPWTAHGLQSPQNSTNTYKNTPRVNTTLSNNYTFLHFSIDIFLVTSIFSSTSYSCNISHHIKTHLGRVTHICASKLTIIGSDNGLSPGRRQAITSTNHGILSIRTSGNKLQWNPRQNLFISIQENAFENVVCERASI